MSSDQSSQKVTSGETPTLKVLLAEDNVTNQKLAIAILEKRGHRVTVVGDGREAVAAYEKNPFDVVLMDMQMPDVDGLEAAATIRAIEKSTGRHTPIIALTANAMIGDRERCLKAGMDEYLSKPLRAEDLIRTIDQLTATPDCSPGRAPGPAGASPAESNTDIFDYAESVKQVGDDAELLTQLVAVFLEQLPLLLPPLEAAVTGGDAKAVRQTAHALCSSVSVIAAPRAKNIARKLELMGLNSDLNGSKEVHDLLLKEFAALCQLLNTTPSLKAA